MILGTDFWSELMVIKGGDTELARSRKEIGITKT